MARPQFAHGSSKALKQTLGRSALHRTPVVIRSADKLGAGFEERIRRQLANRVGQAAALLERVTVRFEDVNGPKGGIDTVCRIKAVLAGRPSIVIEKRAGSHARAFSLAAAALGTAVSRAQRKHGLHTGPSPRPAARSTKSRRADVDGGEIIGRRVGHGPQALAQALERPEKINRAAYTDTATPGVSASDRRAGGNASARRNTLARAPKATAMLEDSRTRPSRKSTRRSANRSKPSQGKERAAAARVQTPSARSARRG